MKEENGMYKKLIGFMVSGVAVFALSGCGSDPVIVDDGPVPITLFLLDQDDFSFEGIPYRCDGMANWDLTAPNGEFTFYEYESCEFDFSGLVGNWYNDPIDDDIVRITDDLGLGVEGISYECASYGGPDVTLYDGSFYYDPGDQCTFYFEGIY